jgi:hypothetical protein
MSMLGHICRPLNESTDVACARSDTLEKFYSNPPPLAFPPSLASMHNNIVNSHYLDIILADVFSWHVELCMASIISQIC